MSPLPQKLLRAREFIRHTYHQPLRLSHISAQANLSPYHFLRLYKRAFSETPHEHLTRLRIERAKTLLKTSDLSVTEVCLEVGFESLSTFSGLFLRYVGLPPSRYKKYAQSTSVVPSAYRTVFVPSCFLSKLGGLEDAEAEPGSL